MRFFQNCHSLDELKKEYRRLAMIHHPDCGGDPETMKAINAEHDEVFEVLKIDHNAKSDEWHQVTEAPEEFREIIDLLMRLDGVDAELCGHWLWISGETRKHKEALKAAGCRWSANKKMWYWRHPEDGCYGRNRKARSMSEIRFKYGSQVFRNGQETDLCGRLSA